MKKFNIRSVAPYSSMFEEFQKSVTDDKDKSKSKVITCLISSAPRSEHGEPKPLPIDQFSGQKFMLNPSGFPMNDIMAYESVQSDQLARAVLNRSAILNLPKNQEMSLEDQFAQIVPSSWSSPAEYVRACKKYGEYAYAKKMEAVRQAEVAAAAEAAKAAKVKKTVVTPTDPE